MVLKLRREIRARDRFGLSIRVIVQNEVNEITPEKVQRKEAKVEGEEEHMELYRDMEKE